MKYFYSRLLTVILFISLFCLAGCLNIRTDTPGTPESALSEQSALPPESATKRPADELVLPDYDVKTSILWDLDGDGARETIAAGLGGEGEFFGNDILLSVSYNGTFNTVTVGSGYFESADYLKTAGGAFCIVVSCGGENDYSSTTLVSFDGLTPVVHGSVDGSANDVSGSEWIAVSVWVDVLGTWPCTRVYRVTDGFTFEPEGDYYINTTGLDPLITKIQVPAEIWKDGDYKKDTLKAGTSIIPCSTDGEKYLEFRIKYPEPEGYTEGRIYFKTEDYIHYIDGVSEFDCFEEVPYAG